MYRTRDLRRERLVTDRASGSGSAHCQMLVNIYMNFHEAILNSFQVTKQTRVCDGQTTQAKITCLPTLIEGNIIHKIDSVLLRLGLVSYKESPWSLPRRDESLIWETLHWAFTVRIWFTNRNPLYVLIAKIKLLSLEFCIVFLCNYEWK